MQSISHWLYAQFAKLKIGPRLALSYGTIIVLLVAMTLVGIDKLRILSETTNDALNDKYPKTIVVNEVINDLGVIARAMRNTLILSDPEQLQVQLRDIDIAKVKMADALAQLKQHVNDAPGIALLDEIGIVHSAYVFNQDEFLSLVAQHRMGEAKNLLVVDLNGYQASYFDLLGKLNRHQGELMSQASQQVDETYRNARNLMLLFAVFAVLLSVGVTVLITRALLKQLGGEPDYATSIARQIAAGNFSSDITIRAKDHSSLLFAMSAMRDGLVERSNALKNVNRELLNTIDMLRQTQEDLVASEKLAALGALVAGIAHELNTPIGNGLMAATALLDFTQGMARRMEHHMTRTELTNYFVQVNEGGDILVRNLSRAAELVSSFKQVAVDRESSQGRSFMLTEVIAETLVTLQPRIKKTVVAVVQDIPATIQMSSYPGPLGQVISNLVCNALIHGFEGRKAGKVTVTAQALLNEQVEIVVQDDGNGIAPDNLSRIFDPFFTTKMGKGGSGLGLHICYNIVTGLLAGKIRVNSRINAGTTFTLTLPTVILGV